MSAKPLLIMSYPESFSQEAIENTQELIQSDLSDDYYVISVSTEGQDFTFRTFDVKDLKETDIQGIKDYVQEQSKRFRFVEGNLLKAYYDGANSGDKDLSEFNVSNYQED